MRSELIWEQDGKPVLPETLSLPLTSPDWTHAHPTAPWNPASKSLNPERIKIQLGFQCNYSCAYCSQSAVRKQEQHKRPDEELVQTFLTQLSSWYRGGGNGRGLGTQFEFWGGETLLYWSSVVKLARHLREHYPEVGLVLFTNGSLIKPEMIDLAREYRIKFSISHDGPGFKKVRNKRDPLSEEGNLKNIKDLFQVLSPLGLVSFNAALTPDNHSLLDIRRHIAAALSVAEREVILSFDIVTPYDDRGLSHVIHPERWTTFIQSVFQDLKAIPLSELHVGSLDRLLLSFYKFFRLRQPAASLTQRCNMDSPDFLAVDLKGNVLTCQNVSAQSGHAIGHTQEYDKIRLHTAYHWSQRAECGQCPVLMLCRGACMFLENKLWSFACDQFFAFHLPILAFALYLATDRELVRIEGANIRGQEGCNEVPVLQHLPKRPIHALGAQAQCQSH